jgi:hypothetical protein
MEARQIYPRSSNANAIVTEVEQHETRYFNGRRYYVHRSLEHYIMPGHYERGFWVHTTVVILRGKMRCERYNSLRS